MRRCLTALAAVAGGSTIAFAAAGFAAPDAAPKLSWPLACELGRTCFIQRYVDRDPGPGAKDYTCGSDTQDEHGGTDIRLRDLADQRRGVAVLAAAAGRVSRLRDGVPDVSVRERGLAAVKGAECGNAVVIDHGGGWETQYCHLANGSISVRPGQQVQAGAPIGRVGLSGETEFPHLHLSVRHGSQGVDPFAPDPGAGGSCGSGASLWRATPPYLARTVINSGFATRSLTLPDIEAGDIAPPTAAAPVVAAYARIINLKPGDVVSLALTGPGGVTAGPLVEQPLLRPEAVRFILAGKRRPQGGWPKGRYRADLRIENGGKAVLMQSFEVLI